MALTHRERAELAYHSYAEVLAVFTEHHETSSKALIEAMAVESFKHALVVDFEKWRSEEARNAVEEAQKHMMDPLRELFDAMGIKMPKPDKVLTDEERAELARAFDDYRKRTEEARKKDEEGNGDGDTKHEG
jgi:hypothetical protein